RMRKAQPAKIDEIAESFVTCGQLEPIIVRPVGKHFETIAGAHRYWAAAKRGLPTIRAEVCDVDDDTALLMEIDENLIRGELSPAERALHLVRRKELYEKAHPETKQGAIGRGRKKSSQNEKSFVIDTAKQTGKGRSTVARDITRANK